MRNGILLVGAGLFFFNAGCTQLSTMSAPRMWPFKAEQSADSKRYGPTPDQREEATLLLGSRASRMESEEFARTAHALSLRVQNEPNARLRAAVVRSLGSFNTPDSIAGLKIAAKDGDTRVRIATCNAWRKIKSEDSVSALAEILASDTDVDVRLAAASGLGDFQGNRFAVASLLVGLDDPDPALQHETVLSLKKVTGKDYGGDLAAWRTSIAGGEPVVPPTPSIADRLKSWIR